MKIFVKIAAILTKKRSRRCALSRAKRTFATPLLVEVKTFDKNSSLLFPELCVVPLTFFFRTKSLLRSCKSAETPTRRHGGAEKSLTCARTEQCGKRKSRKKEGKKIIIKKGEKKGTFLQIFPFLCVGVPGDMINSCFLFAKALYYLSQLLRLTSLILSAKRRY